MDIIGINRPITVDLIRANQMKGNLNGAARVFTVASSSLTFDSTLVVCAGLCSAGGP